MLEIHTINGVQFIKSFELYRNTGCNLKNYSRWIKSNVLEHGVEGFDYVTTEREHLLLLNFGRKSDMYLLTIDFCKALCLVAKTRAAKKTRLWLHSI